MITKGIAALAGAGALGVSLAACGSSAPPARDVQACEETRHLLNTGSEDWTLYEVAAAIAVTPDLKKGIEGLTSLGAVSVPGVAGQAADDAANASVRLTGALCDRDGVSGIR